MSRKRIFRCLECDTLFSGRTAFDYHMNVHKRTAPAISRIKPARGRHLGYDEPSGNEPAEPEGAQ